MALPKITLDRIFENAFNCTSKLKEEKRGASYCLGFQAGYEAGATAENERAQKLAEALEWIKTYGPVDDLTIKFIDKALNEWNGAASPDRPCPHCGKELNRDRNLCCRECGEEVKA